MPGPLEGRVAVVTGASSGIGEATARALSEAGAAVALGARRADRLEAIADSLDGATFVRAVDITDEACELHHGCDPHIEIGDERIDVEDADRYQLELENMGDAIRGEAEPLLGRADAVGQARTIDALYRSAETGTAVTL